MSSYNYRQNREEIQELLHQFENLKSGKSHSFLDEEAFEKIIDYYDEKEDLAKALDVTEYAVERYSYSSTMLLKRADLLIASKRYKESLAMPAINRNCLTIAISICIF